MESALVFFQSAVVSEAVPVVAVATLFLSGGQVSLRLEQSQMMVF